MKLSKLEKLLETVTTGSIAIAPCTLGSSNSSKYGLESLRKRLKNRKKNTVIDPNSFSVVSEYDYSKVSQDATEIAKSYHADGLSIDEIIKRMVKVFDVTVVKQAVRGLK